MTKRFLMLAMTMILAVSSAWGDNVKVSANQTTIWEFSGQSAADITTTTVINGLYIIAKSNSIAKYNSLNRSGTFSDNSNWNTNGICLYLANNSNLTPTSSYFSNLSNEGTNRTSRSAAFETSSAGKLYAAISSGAETGAINLYKVASNETVISSIDVASDLNNNNVALIEEELTDIGIYVLGSKNAVTSLCYMKFVPEAVTAPTINDDGTITAGTSNLAGNGNVDIKTYYTIDGSTTPTTESSEYNGTLIEASGTVTVKAISVNTVTGTTSSVTTKEITITPPNYQLSIYFDSNKGSITVNEENFTGTGEYAMGTSLTLVASPASGYQFVEWTDGEDTRLSTLNTYTTTITEATTLKAVFKQPTNPAIGITEEKTWTFVNFDVNTILSGTKVYEFDGLYISGHNDDTRNQAQVLTISPAVETTIAGELSKRLRIAGKNNSIKANSNVAAFNQDAIAFQAGKAGVVTADVKGSTGNKYNIFVNGTKTEVDMTGALQLLQQDLTAPAAVFISSNNGAHDIYAVKFTPETVTAPTISVTENVGTITAGTSNLTSEGNKDIETRYTIDGTDPTSESTPYNGVIMASGSNITVKAICINKVTGTTSAVTTETGLTLSLPSKTLEVSAGDGGTVTWKVAGESENTTETNFEQGTTIEVTATANNGYMFKNWTSGEEVKAKTNVYTFVMNDNVTLTANFKDMGNKVPVILTAGQSNTDGRIEEDLPASFTGLANCKWSYANAKASPAGTFNNKVWEIGDFVAYTPTSDTGTQWAYDAVVYDQIGKNLGSDFYVIKQSKGNTGISPASGGCGLFWSANPLWLSRNTSANAGGLSLLKALCDHIDASLANIPSGKTADIKFLMWHQGEGDGSNLQGSAYYDQLKALIIHVRNHLATKNTKYSNLPFILGGISPSSNQYNADVEAAKQQLATEDANVYYVSADGITADGLKSDVLHFNAAGGQTFGERVWQTIYENNLLLGLEDNTGSSEAILTGLEEATPIAATTEWEFSESSTTTYTEKTNLSGLYLQASSTNNMSIREDENITSVSYIDNTSVTTSEYVYSPFADRSGYTKYGLTAGDAMGVHLIGINTSEAGTFYAIVAPDTNPAENQATRNMYLVFGGEKVDTKNVRTVWDANDSHTTTLKYTADKAGTFFLTSDHAYRLYAAKFVKAGEEVGGFTITTEAVGGSIALTAPNNKTLSDVFSKNDEVTLEATADENYEFVKWTDGNDTELGTNTTLTLAITSDITVKAIFRGHTPTKAAAYDVMGIVAKGDTLQYNTESPLTFYERESSTTDEVTTWSEKNRSDFQAITTFDSKIAIRLGYKGVQKRTKDNIETYRFTRAFAIQNLGQGDEIIIRYIGGGTLNNITPNTNVSGAKFTIDGTEIATDGGIVESGKAIKITQAISPDNYIVLLPSGEVDITGIFINQSETEKVSNPSIRERKVDDVVVPNVVTLRHGTSTTGKSVTTYYTTDGTNPTASTTTLLAAEKSSANITVDESCTVKAISISETGVASGVTEYKVSLPAASKSASVVYDWQNLALHSDTLKFATDGLTVYDKEYDSTKGWETKKRTDFLAATNLDSKVSVRNGYKGLIYDNTKKTIRLTKPLAIHNLAVDDEIVIIYTGDGSLYSGAADEGDVFTVNGKAAPAGTAIPSGAVIKVTKQKYENNYVVVTPLAATSGKVFISAIYINHASPTVVNTPKAELASVDLDRMTSTYRFTFDEAAMLYYKDTKDNEVIAGSNTGTFDLVVAESAKLKAWEMNGTLVSDTLSVTVYAPTPAPSTTGNFDFTEASEDLPADIEVTLDAGKSVSVGGETLYKPSALTAATFGDKFAFTETGSSNKIRIRTNHQLVFAKGTNMSMALLNMKKGDIIAFNYTGSITFADPSQVSTESSAVKARGTTRGEGNDMESGTAYVVKADGNILLNLILTENSTNISKMYIAAVPTAAPSATIDFATASENYEEVETGGSTSVYVYGKSTAVTFKRLLNSSDELPIDGMISTEGGSGEITTDGIKAANRHIAIHNLAAGDKITVSFFGGELTFNGHETYGNRVGVDGKTLAAQSALKSGDVMVVEKVDYLNNYVVLKLDSKCCISGIFINRDEEEKVWAPTIIENGKNTVLITAGRSSLGYQVTTYYTTDGTDPSDRNGIGGPYDSYDVELLDGSLVPVKAISYSASGKASGITTFNIFADTRTEIIGVPVEDGKEQVIYDLQGRKVETPMEGRIYIIDGKKKLYRRK